MINIPKDIQEKKIDVNSVPIIPHRNKLEMKNKNKYDENKMHSDKWGSFADYCSRTGLWYFRREPCSRGAGQLTTAAG